jgi:putative membrane protein
VAAGRERQALRTRTLLTLGIVLSMSLGVALAAWLVVANNAGAVLRAFAAVGWGLAAIVFIRAAVVALNGTAWAQLLAGAAPTPTRVCLLLRWIREAINVLLPVANVGGEIVGARLLTFWRVPAGIAIASALADLLLQAGAQAVFALVGAVLLVGMVGVWPVGAEVGAGFAVAALALGGFYVVQRHGGARFIDRALVALAARWPSAGAAADLRLHEGLEAIWRDWRRVAITTSIHMVGWLIGTLEVLIALELMGHPVSLKAAIILESLTHAVRGAAFVIPGALGAQEAGLVVLGHLVGLAPETALALSLVKRVPDLALGLPGLWAWHWLEVRRLLSTRRWTRSEAQSAEAQPRPRPSSLIGER